ncbi:DUF5058 family protein [Lagierella sp.]|uniref:DUF5058 family protein n=1 Tax=Lagierella sp. TaxID=2849657 RepID=UPI00262E73A4|nr:DUF5058 family protein [Lagierella sp.]
MSYLKAANSIWLWLACVPTLLLVIYQAIYFYKRVKEASVLVDMGSGEVTKAFKIGAMSAIGPAFGVFVVMLGLSSQIGGPLAWLRLSIIGAAPTELAASEMAANAMGTTLGAADYNLLNFANAAWVTALNGASWLVISGLFADKLDIASKKITGGDTKLLGVISIGAICGAMGFFFANEIAKGVRGNTPAIAAGFTSVIAMVLLHQVSKKYPKLTEYTLGIAMVLGMIAGVIYKNVIG